MPSRRPLTRSRTPVQDVKVADEGKAKIYWDKKTGYFHFSDRKLAMNRPRKRLRLVTKEFFDLYCHEKPNWDKE